MKLTIKAVAGLKLPPGKTDHIEFDDDVPGFGLRLRDSGARTWIFQYTLGAKQRRLALGKASALTPEKARGQAADLHAKVRLGGDPAADKAASKINAALSFKAVADRYLARQRVNLRPRSYVEVERHILTDAKSFHGMPVASIDRSNIAARLADITSAQGAVTANRVRSTMSAMYAWAMKEGLVAANPVAATNKHKETPRERVLSDAELALIWKACRDDDHGWIVKLLMLTGQRLSEISDLSKSEISFDKNLIELPGKRTKNGKPHQLPMSNSVAAILSAQTAKTNRDLLFGYGDDHAFSGWTVAKAQLDARIAEINGSPLPHWVLHDLRRTCATRMADLGVQPHVIEAVLNHIGGHKAGVAGIYNRAIYAPEKAQALTLWANHITALIEGRASNVTALKRT
jgi:integrase